ncbi:MAG TPA: hypothetical protein VN281_19390 [Verrucomicrobiae bacterium]|jgi:hypothetical protein|nr:hypothetical protein [Verrucomicrobiae bacterium]
MGIEDPPSLKSSYGEAGDDEDEDEHDDQARSFAVVIGGISAIVFAL